MDLDAIDALSAASSSDEEVVDSGEDSVWPPTSTATTDFSPTPAALPKASKKRAAPSSPPLTVSSLTSACAPLCCPSSDAAAVPPPPSCLDAKLHPHQAIGVGWLAAVYGEGRGCILADAMGLGKTVQAIGMLVAAVEGGDRGPFLVVSPLSVVANWASELRRFAPSLELMTYSGLGPEREAMQGDIRKHVMKQPAAARKDPELPFHVMLVSYDALLRDVDFLARFKWRCATFDEAHRLKSPATLSYKAVTGSLSITRRVLLTGTPVNNNLHELYALLHLAVPSVFPLDQADSFLGLFAAPDGALNPAMHGVLQDVLKPVMLRRTAEAAKLDLPTCTEVLVRCPPTPLQKKCMLAAVKGNLHAIASKKATGLSNVLAQLRKICNHPYCLPGVEPGPPFEEGEHIVEASSKLLILDQLLTGLRTDGHQVLLFSQSTTVLDVIQDYLSYRRWPCVRLDGSARADDREEAVAAFQDDTRDTFVFLLSTRAGGVGLNLTCADTVILYDSDFNPHMDEQAKKRAHRMGQTKPVRVIRLVTSDSVDEYIVRRALTKLQLARDVMQGGGAGGDAEDADSDSLLRVIQSGLAGVAGAEGGSDPGDGAGAGAATAPSASSVDDLKLSPEEVVDILRRDGGHAVASTSQVLEVDALMDTLQSEAYDKAEAADKRALDALQASAAAAVAAASDAPQQRRRPPPPPVDREAKAAAAAAAKAKRWAKAGYSSLALADPPVGDGGDAATGGVTYVLGDATRPQSQSSSPPAPLDPDADTEVESDDEGKVVTVIAVAVDASGRWGRGGMFRSVDTNLTPAIGVAYEAAKRNGDLRVGDAHLVPVSASTFVCLLVALRRTAGGVGLVQPALSTALRKVKAWADASGRDVCLHTPRIGHGTGVSWYAVERMLRLVGLPVVVYRYQRPALGGGGGGGKRPRLA